MANFDRSWDETSPTDNEAASLIYQELRSLKTDIRERIVGFAAGVLADLPAPEAVFGSASDGVMFFATDTRQIFRWNGQAWVDITSVFERGYTFQDLTTPSVTNALANNVIVPAGTFGAGYTLELTTAFSRTDGLGGANIIPEIRINGVAVTGVANVALAGDLPYTAYLEIVIVADISTLYLGEIHGPGFAEIINNGPEIALANNLNITTFVNSAQTWTCGPLIIRAY